MRLQQAQYPTTRQIVSRLKRDRAIRTELTLKMRHKAGRLVATVGTRLSVLGPPVSEHDYQALKLSSNARGFLRYMLVGDIIGTHSGGAQERTNHRICDSVFRAVRVVWAD